MTWTRLIYGTAILAALSGTAIYYGGNRTVVRSIDLIELNEAANERLMPFGYRLATNIVTVHQPTWTVDPATNRWQSGSYQIPYLVYAGIQTITLTNINVTEIVSQATSGNVDWDADTTPGAWYGWWSGSPVPDVDDFYLHGALSGWDISLVQTGRTLIDGLEYPASILDVHPVGVGVYNAGSTLAWIDQVLINLIPLYVDHEQAISGVFTGAIPMLSVSSVWNRLNLPYVWTNVSRVVTNTYTNWVDSWTNEAGTATNVVRIGTNAAWNLSTNITTNCTFTSGTVCTTNMLAERYKVASYLRWTKGTTPTWTNSVRLTWIESIYDTSGDFTRNDYQSYEGHPPPTFPAWWDFDATNTYSAPYYLPTTTATIDDTETGSLITTNIAPHRPERQFVAFGSIRKSQWYEDFYYPGFRQEYGYWALYHKAATNTVTRHESSVRVVVPYNIAGITVTGDVYMTTVTGGVYRGISSSMTASNMSLIYTSAVFALSNDLFAATNYPVNEHTGIGYEWPDYGGTYWPWPNEGVGYNWGAKWSVSEDWWVDTSSVVFKWEFLRCHP
jgi:hypothetical protein